MKNRQAKKIVKNQAIYCQDWTTGESIPTAGRHSYAEATYRKALRIILRKMDRELTERKPGAIERLAKLNQERNAARLAVLIARAAA